MQQCRSNEYVNEAMLMTRKLAKTWGLTRGMMYFISTLAVAGEMKRTKADDNGYTIWPKAPTAKRWLYP